MPYWVRLIEVFWPVGLVLCSVAAFVAVLWLRSQFHSARDAKELETKLTALETSVKTMENTLAQMKLDSDSAPTRMELLTGINKLTERLAMMEANSEALQRTLALQNEANAQRLASIDRYMQALVENGLERGHGR